MSLPTIEVQTHELTLPSANVQVKYRPFLVKEEKVLLQALENNDDKGINRAIKEIVHACTFGQIDGGKIPTFDLEYIFLNIRAKSIGEIAKVRLLCPDDKKTYGEAQIDLTKVEVEVDDNHTNKIMIDENRKLGIIMKYPTIDSADPSLNLQGQGTQKIFDMIGNCIHEIFDGETVHSASDYSKEDLHKFIGDLDKKTFDKINRFFNTMPQLKHEVEIENPKTKVKSKIVLKGAQDFFVLPSLTTA
tara:strand:- start:2137 stop:2874 length:738 start_codon:yes stop_codon:yes gene_type:complete